VEFSHNTVTGAQLLLVDGDVFHKTSYKYRLTGCLFWTLDDQLCELYVICEGAPIHAVWLCQLPSVSQLLARKSQLAVCSLFDWTSLSR